MSFVPEPPRNHRPLSRTAAGWWFPGTLVFTVALVLRAIAANSVNVTLQGAFEALRSGGPSTRSIFIDLMAETGLAGMVVGVAMVIIAYNAMLRE